MMVCLVNEVASLPLPFTCIVCPIIDMQETLLISLPLLLVPLTSPSSLPTQYSILPMVSDEERRERVLVITEEETRQKKKEK